MATTRTSAMGRRSSEGVVTAKRGSRRARVVPAAPRKGRVRLMENAMGQKSRSPRGGGGKRGCGGSPLLVSHVRGNICSSSTVYAQRGCEERRALDESCVSGKGDAPKELSSADPFTVPLVILSEYFLTRILGEGFGLSKRQRM
jgi:hypothetical protein